MTKLHQLLAIERGVVADTDRKIALATRGIDVTGEQSPLTGISRTYQPRREDGDPLPAQFQHVQIKAEDVLGMVAEATTRLMDVKFTREEGNTSARGTVTIDGQVLLRDAPAGYLLYLEGALGQLRTLLLRFPVLDPAEEWHFDQARSVYATTPKDTVRSHRVPKAQVLYEATKEHPAQVRAYEVEEPIGDWTTVKLSGALPAGRLAEILDRITKLTEAVKMAREDANRLEVTDRTAGEIVFRYVLDGAIINGNAASS